MNTVFWETVFSAWVIIRTEEDRIATKTAAATAVANAVQQRGEKTSILDFGIDMEGLIDDDE